MFYGHKGWVVDAKFSKDGSKILSSAWDNTARIWNKNGEIEKVLNHPNYVVSAIVESNLGNYFTQNGNSGYVLKFDSSGTLVDTFMHEYPLAQYGLSILKDEKCVISMDYNGSSVIWMKGGAKKILLNEKLQVLEINGVNFFYSFSTDSSVYLYSWKDLKNEEGLTRINQIKIKGSIISSVKYSNSDNLFFTICSDSSLRIFDGKEIFNLYNADKINNNELVSINIGAQITNMIISPNQKSLLISADNNVMYLYKISDLLSDKSVHKSPSVVFSGHSEKITDFNFSQNNEWIVSSSSDKSVILWNLEGGIEQVYNGHTGRVLKSMFSNDDQSVLSASDDHSVRLMPTTIQQVLDKINVEKVRGDVYELTDADKKVYGIE